MALDLIRTAEQLDKMSETVKLEASERLSTLDDIVALLVDWDHEKYLKNLGVDIGAFRLPPADINENPAATYPSVEMPDEYTVIGVDGST